MAKKKASPKNNGTTNKSQAIRDELAKDPNASPKQLSANLAAKGVVVSPSYISIIKSNMKSKGQRPTRNSVASRSRGTLAPSDLLEAKKLVDRVGGFENAEALIGTLRKLL